MSTIAYSLMTSTREKQDPAFTAGKTGVPKYIDAMAALVPAEVLALHATLLTFTSKTEGPITTITEPEILQWSFFGMILLTVVFYWAFKTTSADKWDWVRGLIPGAAFVAWTMLQKSTAFDAISTLGAAERNAIALFLAIALGVLATKLAIKADEKPVVANTSGALQTS